MRTIGAAEEALELMCNRLQSRVAFGKKISEHSIWEQRVAEARIEIDCTRLLCLKAADMLRSDSRPDTSLAKLAVASASPSIAPSATTGSPRVTVTNTGRSA